MKRRVIGWSLGIALALLAPLAAAHNTPQEPQPTFRAVTSLVPIDVRVLDRNGRPITDLRAGDFSVFENGAQQKLGHFSAVALATTPPAPNAAPIRRGLPSETAPLTPPTRRLFLITLGRGRLQHPSMGVDAAITFVRQRLLPQDQVAIAAYNRATDFTTDRDQTLQVLERFKASHLSIEAKMHQHYSGPAGVYGSAEIPQGFQAEIDAVFKGAGAPAVRELPPGRITDAETLARATRQTTDDLQRLELLRERAAAAAATGQSLSEFDKRELERAGATGLTAASLEEHIQTNRQTMQDLGRIYAGIDYLHHIDGEKHLVFVTERGFLLPRLEDDLSLAAVANNARVAIDIIQTGGHTPTMRAPFNSVGVPPGMPIVDIMKGEPFEGPYNQRFAVSGMKQIAELTGGQASFYEFSDKAFDRIATSTSTGYLLGYYPSHPAVDGKYRNIRVKVNRTGATVLYRHGYFAEPPRAPFDRRRALIYNRVVAAINYPPDIKDLALNLTTTELKGSGRIPDFIVNLTIDISRIGLTLEEGRRKGGLDIAVFCQDATGDGVGDLWQKMDLNLSEPTFQRMSKEGLTYTGRISPPRPVTHVKVVVYDYASDRIGTVMRRVR